MATFGRVPTAPSHSGSAPSPSVSASGECPSREAAYFPKDLRGADRLGWIAGYYGPQLPPGVAQELIDLAYQWPEASQDHDPEVEGEDDREIGRILAMSGDELRAELVAEGHDPDALVRQMKQGLDGTLRLAADRQRWREEAASWRRVAERLEAEKRAVLKVKRERIAKIINPDAFVGLGDPDYYGPELGRAWASAGQRVALKKADAILSAAPASGIAAPKGPAEGESPVGNAETPTPSPSASRVGEA